MDIGVTPGVAGVGCHPRPKCYVDLGWHATLVEDFRYIFKNLAAPAKIRGKWKKSK